MTHHCSTVIVRYMSMTVEQMEVRTDMDTKGFMMPWGTIFDLLENKLNACDPGEQEVVKDVLLERLHLSSPGRRPPSA